MSRAFIGLGSNEGERLECISQAMHMLASVPAVRVVQMAMISETEPVGGPPQGPYLNTVAEIETTLTPRELLKTLQDIERRLGRQPSSQRWAPRPIDLDILLYDDCVIEEPGLSIPHPRMHERLFVLEPLAQLAPEVRHPILHHTIAQLLVHFEVSDTSQSGGGV